MIKQLLLLFLIAGMALTAVATPQTRIQAEEYAVFSAVIKDRYSSGSTRLIVIKDHTEVHVMDHTLAADLDFVHERQPSIPQKMLDDFRFLNRQSYLLSRNFNIKKQYVFVSDGELGEIFKSGVTEWKAFYSKFPESSGCASFSRVVFRPHTDQALVYTAISCGESCGQGNYLLLNKRDGTWKIEKEVKVLEMNTAPAEVRPQ